MSAHLPDLIESLQGHDLGHLRIIAERWGLEFDAPDFKTGLKRLAPMLLDRQLVNEVVAALPERAREALQDLLQNEGRLALATFVRRYGALRAMGAARRDRERPYLPENASPSEALWYRGLVGRAFFDTPTGAEEFVYIPQDFLSLLPPVENRQPAPLGRPATSRERATLIPADDRIVDDACTLLAALRLGMPLEEAQRFFTCAVRSPYPLTPQALQLLLAEAGLLDEKAMPLPEPVRAFLESSRAEALTSLVNAWYRAARFNELRLIPSLVVEGDWHNDPLRARYAILDFLHTVPGDFTLTSDHHERPFWSLEAFIAAVHQRYPDYQRPAGDYDSWYLRHRGSGEFLRGFPNWDKVDGELIRFFICGVLHWLGVMDLTAPAEEPGGEKLPISGFRFSAWAQDLLNHLPPKGLDGEEARLLARSDGRLLVPANAPRAVRYQVARFCAWEAVEAGIYHYRLTPASLERARKQGLKVQHLEALLKRYAQVFPPSLTQALRRWDAHGDEARLDELLVLRVKSPEVLQALLNSKARRFLGDALGPTAVIVKPGAMERVLAAMVELGFFVDHP